MRNPLHLVTYYDTYYYCNIVQNILGNQPDYLVTMHSLFEDERTVFFAAPWQKWTALHRFVAQCVNGLFFEDLELYADKPLAFGKQMGARFQNYSIDHLTMAEFLADRQRPASGLDQDDAYEYLLELGFVGNLETLIERIADEVFFVMFLNREALARLNSWIAGYVGQVTAEDLVSVDPAVAEQSVHFKSAGQLKRKKPPRWVKEAVFYRDRGHCAQCGGDLTNISYVGADDHYDHIVPLAEGGLNDVTNIQLLCSGCNLKKGSRAIPVSRLYQRWYAVQEK